MDIRKRFGSNISAVKMLPFVGISTIGDGFSSIYTIFIRFFVIKNTFFTVTQTRIDLHLMSGIFINKDIKEYWSKWWRIKTP